VLVDTWSFLDDIVLNTMDIADRILIVMVPEIPSIKSTKLFLEVAEALKFPPQQIDLILNKALVRDSIRGEQIAKSMHHNIQVELEFEPRGLRQSTNQGLPLIVSEPNHPFVVGIQGLAEHLVSVLQPHAVKEITEEAEPSPEKPKRRSGLFGRMKR
jgi:MinD-like ATPase involved in chromosome partitioning or flagellar assembly